MPDTPGSEPAARPIGFLSVRLEHTAAGVRATVCWSSDVACRHNDRQTQTLDRDRVLARVDEFVREFAAGS